jgi:glycosyltransferase involved in cell wall biosynthesis
MLVIAGEPNYRSPVVRRLKEINDPRIKLLGHVDKPEDYRELNYNCYAYIHGHSVGGTNPSLLRALGFGNCVLAFDVPFNREVLRDYGLYFGEDEGELTGKIQYLEDHPEEVERYRRRAPERIRRAYTWEKITDQYEELFRRMASA